MYLGNPFHRTPELLTGGQTSYPVHSYCVTDDFVCDFGPRSVFLALTDEDDAGVHAEYFSAAVADRTPRPPVTVAPPTPSLAGCFFFFFFSRVPPAEGTR